MAATGRSAQPTRHIGSVKRPSVPQLRMRIRRRDHHRARTGQRPVRPSLALLRSRECDGPPFIRCMTVAKSGYPATLLQLSRININGGAIFENMDSARKMHLYDVRCCQLSALMA